LDNTQQNQSQSQQDYGFFETLADILVFIILLVAFPIMALVIVMILLVPMVLIFFKSTRNPKELLEDILAFMKLVAFDVRQVYDDNYKPIEKQPENRKFKWGDIRWKSS